MEQEDSTDDQSLLRLERLREEIGDVLDIYLK